MRRRAWWWKAGSVALAVLVLTGLGTAAEEAPGALREGDLQALREQVAALRGAPVLVNFWATWCLPCIQEVPALNDLQGRLGSHGLRTLAVSLDPFVYPGPGEARGKVEKFVAERGFRLPQFLYSGEQESLMEAWQLPAGLPVTLLLDREGKVAERVEGQLEPAELRRIEKRFEALLGG